VPCNSLALLPCGSATGEERLGCISVKAALQQTATEKIMRAVRTNADMFERPCFRRRRSGFPIPFPENYRALCAKTFSVGFIDRGACADIERRGERILKRELARAEEAERDPKYARKCRVRAARCRRTLGLC
jgi:hypothetical protein